MATIARVEHPTNPYPVHIGDNPWRAFISTLAAADLPGGPLDPSVTVAVVADATTAEIHGPSVEAAFISAGYQVLPLVVPAGEECKTWAVAGALHEAFTTASLQPTDVVVGLGGGATIDLAGFVAATFRRGVRFIAAPTTLLGMVDASLGGKSAVNMGGRKNVVGAVVSPLAVVDDLDFLVTLSDERFREGVVELAKNAILLGEESLAWLESALPAILDRDGDQLIEAIVRSVALQSAADNGGFSGLGDHALSLGHEFAYALEERSDGTVSHGAALAEGLRFSLAVGEVYAGAEPTLSVRLASILEQVGFEPLANDDTTLDIGVALRSTRRVAAGHAEILVATSPGALATVTLTEQQLFEAIRDHYGRERYRDYAFEAKMAAREAEAAERELAELQAEAALETDDVADVERDAAPASPVASDAPPQSRED